MKVDTEEQRNLPRKRRLRKKLHVGEFKELATMIKGTGFDRLYDLDDGEAYDKLFDTLSANNVNLEWLSVSKNDDGTTSGVAIIDRGDDFSVGILGSTLMGIGVTISDCRVFDAHYDDSEV